MRTQTRMVNTLRNVLGRAVVQAVNRRFPTAVARVRAKVKSYVGAVVDRAAVGQVFFGYFRIPLQLIHCTNCSTIITIIQGWYRRPINSPGNSGPGSTPTPWVNKQKIGARVPATLRTRQNTAHRNTSPRRASRPCLQFAQVNRHYFQNDLHC
jgi:hypothetical protein